MPLIKKLEQYCDKQELEKSFKLISEIVPEWKNLMNNKQFPKILVTGAAGFIGAALCKKLLSNGIEVVGIDDLNPYYDPKYKKQRLRNIEENLNCDNDQWTFLRVLWKIISS